MKGIAAKRIVTCDPTRGDALGIITDGAVLYDDTGIRWVGPRADAPTAEITDYGDRVVTPGLVDAHTHAAWMGSRHDEYVLKITGADYRAIAAAGGGILSTFRAVSAASEDEIAKSLEERLLRMARLGVTTCEVKSGYGLEPDGERKQLRAIERARKSSSLPHVVSTFLALHALPESAKADRAAYIKRAAELVPEMASLANFVDCYVDQNAFTVEEARLVCEAARKANLGVRMHVGQFADVGGAELCAAVGAKSADHLENIGPKGIEALANANVAATLLPLASFTLGQAPPPVKALREAGVSLVVASDSNPGTAPSESLPLAMAFAVRMYGLTAAEALLGATRHAALSLNLSDRGVLAVGKQADIVVWDLPHENALIQPWGVSKTHRILRAGRALL